MFSFSDFRPTPRMLLDQKNEQPICVQAVEQQLHVTFPLQPRQQSLKIEGANQFVRPPGLLQMAYNFNNKWAYKWVCNLLARGPFWHCYCIFFHQNFGLQEALRSNKGFPSSFPISVLKIYNFKVHYVGWAMHGPSHQGILYADRIPKGNTFHEP